LAITARGNLTIASEATQIDAAAAQGRRTY
jgi:hypothetical protein